MHTCMHTHEEQRNTDPRLELGHHFGLLVPPHAVPHRLLYMNLTCITCVSVSHALMGGVKSSQSTLHRIPSSRIHALLASPSHFAPYSCQRPCRPPTAPPPARPATLPGRSVVLIECPIAYARHKSPMLVPRLHRHVWSKSTYLCALQQPLWLFLSLLQPEQTHDEVVLWQLALGECWNDKGADDRSALEC